jgi:hypothetical protein
MKILIISNDLRSSIKVRTFLASRSVIADPVILSNERIDDYLNNNIQNYQAVVFDRISLNIENYLEKLVKLDCYFIVHSFNQIKFENIANFDLSFRFYYLPLNYQLLVDDIKSITLIKKYITDEQIKIDGLTIDLNKRVVSNGEQEIYLRNKEFELLIYMARNKGKLLSRINILENVWDMNANIVTNTVDVHVSKIRKVLKDKFKLDLIKTIPCSGYILV